jgi:hypothetical protein
LDGLSELSDSAAGLIARHTGLLRLNGLKAISDSAAETLARDTWPVQLNVSILSDSPGHAALRAKVEAPTRFVEIGITDPIAEVFGATKFKICWDLDYNTVTNAGFDIDWASGSVMYDFATGRAWKLEMLKELIEKGLAVPNLRYVHGRRAGGMFRLRPRPRESCRHYQACACPRTGISSFEGHYLHKLDGHHFNPTNTSNL